MPHLIEDLTNAEIEALTEEDIERFIKLECAEQGVSILLEYPEPLEPIELTPDIEIYKIGDVVFVNRDDAERIVAEMNKSARADLSYGDNVNGRYIKHINGPDHDTIQVAVEGVFSNVSYIQQVSKIKKRVADQKEYDSEKKKYEESRIKYDKIASAIRDRHVHAVTRARERDRMIRMMREYEKLAEGNIQIAFKFFQKAVPDIATRFPEIFSGDWTRYAVLSRRDEATVVEDTEDNSTPI